MYPSLVARVPDKNFGLRMTVVVIQYDLRRSGGTIVAGQCSVYYVLLHHSTMNLILDLALCESVAMKLRPPFFNNVL